MVKEKFVWVGYKSYLTTGSLGQWKNIKNNP
jgi:hypothetical protein